MRILVFSSGRAVVLDRVVAPVVLLPHSYVAVAWQPVSELATMRDSRDEHLSRSEGKKSVKVFVPLIRTETEPTSYNFSTKVGVNSPTIPLKPTGAGLTVCSH